MRVLLVNPPLALQRGDFLGSGIPYMPHGCLHLAAALRLAGHEARVVDLFGQDPFFGVRAGDAVWQGAPPEAACGEVARSADAVFVYARSVAEYGAVVEIVRLIRASGAAGKIVVFENAQAVIGFSLSFAADALMEAGCDYLITGDPEDAAAALLGGLAAGGVPPLPPGVRGRDNPGLPPEPVADLDRLPFPDWRDIPLENYWRLGYGHGPVGGRYLAILTSRGCPFHCRFCVVPQTNLQKWRARSPGNVVDEIEWNHDRLGVAEFHWEDLNPTVDRERMGRICEELIRRGLRVRWKLVSGTKLETIDAATLPLMARAGCSYLSFSPESGSARVLEAMDKPFDYGHGLAMTRLMRRLRVRSQACFVIGFPGETPADLRLTAAYAADLTRAGVDEVAFFILTPIPGTPTFSAMSGYRSFTELTFSPAWRADYGRLSRWRFGQYSLFLLRRAARFPIGLARQCATMIRGRFETKMEMTPRRAWHQRRICRRAAFLEVRP